jgi:Cu(I)/Ag(I) efflux system membrane fusion protein
MFVSPSMKVMTLGDLSSVWLLAEVFERQSEWVEVGQHAEVNLSYIPGEIWQGKVEYIYPSLDAKTRTLKVRLRFDNPGERLKPNMYANVKIFGGAKENTIVIPLEALIKTGREQRVIISLGEGTFEAREVIAGIESGNYVEIVKGLKVGESVVTSGQFLIDSEASMRGSISRMTDMPMSDMAMPDMAAPDKAVTP